MVKHVVYEGEYVLFVTKSKKCFTKLHFSIGTELVERPRMLGGEREKYFRLER